MWDSLCVALTSQAQLLQWLWKGFHFDYNIGTSIAEPSSAIWWVRLSGSEKTLSMVNSKPSLWRSKANLLPLQSVLSYCSHVQVQKTSDFCQHWPPVLQFLHQLCCKLFPLANFLCLEDSPGTPLRSFRAAAQGGQFLGYTDKCPVHLHPACQSFLISLGTVWIN